MPDLSWNSNFMAIKIIHKGVPPASIKYECTCSNCSTVLEFQKSDARVVDDRTETAYIVNCPVCFKDIYNASLKRASNFRSATANHPDFGPTWLDR